MLDAPASIAQFRTNTLLRPSEGGNEGPTSISDFGIAFQNPNHQSELQNSFIEITHLS